MVPPSAIGIGAVKATIVPEKFVDVIVPPVRVDPSIVEFVMVGDVRVLFDNVCVSVSPTNSPVGADFKMFTGFVPSPIKTFEASKVSLPVPP